MHWLTMSEARAYLTGQDRRHRQSWEQTRMLMSLVHKMLTGENLNMDLPWDEGVAEKEETTAEDLQRLRALARQEESRMNGNL